jgi:hypothetical protein
MPSKDFIRYQTRGKTEYAMHCKPEWINGKKNNNEIWLGSVISKEHGIFYTHKIGYYKYSLEYGQQKLDDNDIEYYKLLKKEKNIKYRKKN